MPEDVPFSQDLENHEPEGEEGSKASAIALFICYAVGLLTSNFFLYQYGVSDYSLLRPKAVLTGAVVMGSIALLTIAPLTIASRSRARSILTKWFRARKWNAVAFGMPFFCLFLLCYLAETRLDRPTFSVSLFGVVRVGMALHPSTREMMLGGLVTAAQLYIAAFIAAFCSVQCLRYYRRMTHQQSFAGMASGWVRFASLGATAALCLSWYAWVFAEKFYILVPQQFGGGRPEKMRFAVEKDSMPILESLGVRFEAGQPITQSLTVIHESENFVTVLLPFTYQEKNKRGEVSRIISDHTTATIDKKAIRVSLLDAEGLGESLKSIRDSHPTLEKYGH